MLAYKLNLKNDEEIEIYFNKNSACSLTVANSSVYEFVQDGDLLKVSWIIKTGEGNQILEPEINSIQPIEYRDEDFKIAAKSLTNCCSVGEREYCVRNGCIKAPCGRICG